MTFISMVDMIKEVNNNDARQLKVQSILNWLSIQESMRKLKTIDENFSLIDFVINVNVLTA